MKLYRTRAAALLAAACLAGGLLGGLLGGRLFKGLNMTWLRRGFALLILYGGVRTLLG